MHKKKSKKLHQISFSQTVFKNSSFRLLSFIILVFTLFLLTFINLQKQVNYDTRPQSDLDNGGLILPDGFEAVVVIDSIGPARHLAVNHNGDIYVKLRRAYNDGSIAALRDTTNNGKADIVKKFWDYDDIGNTHTAMRLHQGYLYFSSNLMVYRYELTAGKLVPDGKPDTLVIDDHEHGLHGHSGKPISFDNKGNMYIPFGTPTDACQDPDRTPNLPGQDPCPDLEKHGGIWVFDANKKNQVQQESRRQNDRTKPVGIKYASGIRSVVAMDWNPIDENLYVVQHGRDFLFRQWSQHYTQWESAMLPSEEFMRVTEGSNFGWPYCYHDQIQNKKVKAPEYGGDGNIIGRCSEYDNPLIGFPGHFAPNDLLFYRGEQFPDYYKNGAFIAFHGSIIRNPYPQAGYFVAFVPFENEQHSNDWDVFANGFAVVDPIVNTSDAQHRPMGLAVGPDGSLYISDSVDGKIWRVMYTGDREAFGEAHLSRMDEEKQKASNIRTPHKEEDNLDKGIALAGEELYNIYCVACHQSDGQGISGLFPPIAETDWVTGDKKRLISIIIDGSDEPIEVKGEQYNTLMPQHSFLSDEEIAEVATYIRQNFGNNASFVTPEEVREVREILNN